MGPYRWDTLYIEFSCAPLLIYINVPNTEFSIVHIKIYKPNIDINLIKLQVFATWKC